MSRPHLTAGFLPLLDAVTLVLARELGIAEEEGFELTLMRGGEERAVRLELEPGS